ncbi:hypothetical protein ACHAW5_004339 [Stephanodiscus triporus]|uniref:Uncharacterized protein n=1 Tax=Stephanodiscus triporus TaxID=2934178 RepID=A0ABD3QYS8_9STRA
MTPPIRSVRMLWLPLSVLCLNSGSTESTLLRVLEEMPVKAAVCLTQEQCFKAFLSMKTGGDFFTGDFPDKGCFVKNEHGFFGTGGSDEEMAATDLQGVRERIWCERETASPTLISSPPSVPPTLMPTTESPSNEPTSKPVADLTIMSPSLKPTVDPTPLPSTENTTTSPSSTPSTFDPTPKPTPHSAQNPKQVTAKTVTESPSKLPTAKPTPTPVKPYPVKDVYPTYNPSSPPSKKPLLVKDTPTEQVTAKTVTESPSKLPTAKPTPTPVKPYPVKDVYPTYNPSSPPSKKPLLVKDTPTEQVTAKTVTESPSKLRGSSPRPTMAQSPTAVPTTLPSTQKPSLKPSSAPSTFKPSFKPTSLPTAQVPSLTPSSMPITTSPTLNSTSNPSSSPSKKPIRDGVEKDVDLVQNYLDADSSDDSSSSHVALMASVGGFVGISIILIALFVLKKKREQRDRSREGAHGGSFPSDGSGEDARDETIPVYVVDICSNMKSLDEVESRLSRRPAPNILQSPSYFSLETFPADNRGGSCVTNRSELEVLRAY